MKESIKSILPYLLMFLMFIWLTRERSKGDLHGTLDTTSNTVVTYDTIHPPDRVISIKVDPIKGQSFNPDIIREYIDGVYIDRQENEYLKEHIEYLEKNLDSIKNSVKVYKDSLVDENITIYSSDLIEGRLLNKDLKYKLKIPKEIVKTVTTTTEKKVSGLFVTSGLGGNQEKFDNINLGLQFVSKKDYLVGYNYNLLGRSHNLTVGFKLFNRKK